MADKDTRSSWSLALDGDFQTAYSMLSRDIAAEPQRAPHYMNRGLVLLNLSQLVEAQRDFARYSELRPHSSAGYIMFGLVLWLQNNIEPAIESWRRALHATYTDEAGGVEAPTLLYYAGLITQDQERLDEARGLLRKKWRSNMAMVWPGPIVGYLLGLMDEDTFLIRQTFLNPTLEARRLCQAYFWVAVQRLSRGDVSNWTLFLRRSVERPQLLETEYYLARHELARFGQ